MKFLYILSIEISLCTNVDNVNQEPSSFIVAKHSGIKNLNLGKPIQVSSGSDSKLKACPPINFGPTNGESVNVIALLNKDFTSVIISLYGFPLLLS